MNLKYFFTGLSFSLMMIIIVTCSSDKSNPTEPDNNDPTEVPIIQQIEEDTQLITAAFKSGTYDEVKNTLSPGALNKYGDDLKNQTEKYSAFASALENKKLIAFSSFYAEYEIEIDGKKYSVAFSKVTETGKWQLVKM